MILTVNNRSYIYARDILFKRYPIDIHRNPKDNKIHKQFYYYTTRFAYLVDPYQLRPYMVLYLENIKSNWNSYPSTARKIEHMWWVTDMLRYIIMRYIQRKTRK